MAENFIYLLIQNNYITEIYLLSVNLEFSDVTFKLYKIIFPHFD